MCRGRNTGPRHVSCACTVTPALHLTQLDTASLPLQLTCLDAWFAAPHHVVSVSGCREQVKRNRALTRAVRDLEREVKDETERIVARDAARDR